MTRLYLIFLAGTFFISITNTYSQEISKEQAQLIANNLLISKNYKSTIKKVLPSINNIQVLLLNIPYRESPSIVVLNKVGDNWVMIFETLAPGIQDKTSKLLDWHVKKSGVDFTFGNDSYNDFKSEKLRKAIEVSIVKDDVVLIPYQQFIHMNTAENSNPKRHTPYTIDKTHYFDLANILFDGKYNKYPLSECMMFDTPQII